ncbi:MAG: DNA internalization-related competence protein ComEC/Rec2, partial [Burkholderiaceae bacterium]
MDRQGSISDGKGNGDRDSDRAGVLARAIAAAALAFIGGVALQLQQPALWAPSAYGAALVGALAGVLISVMMLARMRRMRASSRSLQLAWLAVLCLGMAALAAASTGWRATLMSQAAIDARLEGRDIAVVGVVSSMPQATDAGVRFRFDIESAALDGQPVRAPSRVWLAWYGGFVPADLQRAPQPLRAGERWAWTVRLKAARGGINPHGFDFELWMWEQRLGATGYVRAGPRDAEPKRVASTWLHPVEQARQAVRDRIAEAVPDARSAGVLAALVTGDQRAIDRADWDLFRATGIAHLMSISGLHVTMFAWLAAAAVGALWRCSARLCLRWPAPHAGLLAGLLLAAGYAVFSGWGVPAQRTVWMLLAVGVLRLSGRVWPASWMWCAAALAVVAVDPWALLQPGFWLSFVAVGVLFAAGRREAAPAREAHAANTGPTFAAGLRAFARHAGALIREQGTVTLALAPLGLLLFGQVSIIGLVANLLAIPWVTLLVTPLAMLGVLWPPLWSLADLALQALSVVLGWLALWPWASLWRPIPDLWAGIAALLGGVLLVLRLPPWLRVLGLPLLLPALLWQVPRPAPGTFELLAADIGQGNAVLVRTARHTLLYDAGPRYSRESDAGHRVLVPLLRAWGEQLDTLVVSHRDSDHSGGAAAVLAQQPQARWLSSVEDWRPLLSAAPVVASAGLGTSAPPEPVRCEAGQRWAWDGVQFEVLHPRTDDYADARRPNALSCVVRIESAPDPQGRRRRALLTGDIELAQESALVASGQLQPVDWLLVPHHGSKTSSSAPFLDATAPRIAVVQAGYRNRFGHPAAPVLERYRERGVRWVSTVDCGAALWRSDQPDAMRCWRDERQRYWHHRM